MSLSDLTGRLNQFFYRQNLRRLTAEELEMAKAWSMEMIRREHPAWSEEQAEAYYEQLLYVHFSAVDEWTRRMS